MRIAVQMPNLGHDIESGKIINWFKKIGETVERGDVIAEVETEKVTLEVEAFGRCLLCRFLGCLLRLLRLLGCPRRSRLFFDDFCVRCCE